MMIGLILTFLGITLLKLADSGRNQTVSEYLSNHPSRKGY